jgi:hypothetical protein
VVCVRAGETPAGIGAIGEHRNILGERSVVWTERMMTIFAIVPG